MASSLFTLQVNAQEHYEFYTGVRQLGMGGAGIAVVNDETALLTNPAGLGKLRDYFVTVADPEIEVGSDNSAFFATDQQKSFTLQEVLNQARNPDNIGKRLHTKAQVFPSFVVPNFGFGFLGKYEMDAEVTEANTANFDVRYNNDFAFVAGFNFRFWDGRIKVGVNTRVINRVNITSTLSAASTDLKINDVAEEGIGIASDVGLIVTAPWDWLPTISAVVRDVGNTTYDLRAGLLTGAGDSRRPAPTEQSIDAAVALFPIVGKRTRMTWTAEYRGVLTAADEEDSMKRIHTGFELNFRDAFFLRGGMNQRYWTAGLELAIANYQLQLASYGEEIGTGPSATREDRRYIFKFAYRF
ncbi:MAG: hypothetical protein HRT45_11995 [Bdellovibrionales bacterium]|nr:hypothetical protein [Bdellovibrionales bacterium]